MLQTICSCGRIAEVRHRKNGKKLAFIHCVNGCGGIVSAKKAAEIEASAKDDIGTKGEFIEKRSENSSENVQSKQGAHFKPEEKDLPENLESSLKNESENSNENSNENFNDKPVKTGNGLKILVGFLGCVLIGGGAYAASKV